MNSYFLKSYKRLLKSFSIFNRTVIIPPEYRNVEPTVTFQDIQTDMFKYVHIQSTLNVNKTNLPDSGLRVKDELEPRRMSDSFDQVILRLSDSNNLKLRDNYITSFGQVRIGCLLENMDVFAAYVVFKHILGDKITSHGSARFSIVTALVDLIRIKESINCEQDIKMMGHVSWVGNTSAESRLELYQRIKGNQWKEVISATFVMVLRNPLPNGQGQINPMILETDEERQYFARGEENRKNRLLSAKESLWEKPPSEVEKIIIHEFFKKTLDRDVLTIEPQGNPPNSVWMQDAKLKTILICQPEFRNIFNKIFGGFIMKKALELAWANTYIFTKKQPEFLHISDIVFKRPVEIGSLLYFSSQVCYTRDNHIQTSVLAEIMDPETGKRSLTNKFHFTFKVEGIKVPHILPKTYLEAMLYLNGRRQYLSNLSKLAQ